MKRCYSVRLLHDELENHLIVCQDGARPYGTETFNPRSFTETIYFTHKSSMSLLYEPKLYTPQPIH